MTDSFDKKSNEKRTRSVLDHFNAKIDAAALTDISEEEDAIDRLLIDTGFDQHYENDLSPSLTETSVHTEEFKIPLVLLDSLTKKNANGEDKKTPPINHLRAATVTTDPQQFLLIKDLESRTKKATLLSFAAISTASAAIIAAIALTINAYRVQSNISSLLDTVSLFQEEKAKIHQHNSTIYLNTLESGVTLSERNRKDSDITGVEKILKTEISSDSNTQAIHSVNKPPENQTNPRNDTGKSPQEEVWYVNLISFKDLKDANQQSAEFIKKGVRTEIIRVKVNNDIWYRLRIGGFTSREQAVGYAKKIKKPLHLNSLWIANS